MVIGSGEFMEKIIVEELYYKYYNSDFCLRNINLKIKNEFVLLTGPSGSGKSTLIYCLTGLIPHYIRNGKMNGNVWIDGKKTKDTPLEELTKKVGIVLQDPESQIFGMTVEEDLVFGLENICMPRYKINKKVNEILNFLELKKFRNKAPETLSGGQKQRLVIGSVLALEPEILVLDEPLSNLDPWGVRLVVSTLEKLKKAGKTIVLVERKIENVIHLVDRVIALENGKIVADESLRKFLANKKLVERLGINVPQVAKLAYHLKSFGFKFKKFPLTIDEFMSELNESYNKN
jgi:energy-coupling factor transporter ATP-binding protein EcfA2